MPDASPYIEAAYAVFAALLVIYVAIIVYRMRNTARQRRSLEAELRERAESDPRGEQHERELERV
jgi:hypothetical protein